jgi:Tfp pilus assembly protein PilN
MGVWLPKHNSVTSAQTKAVAAQASLVAIQGQVTSLSGDTAVQSQVATLRSQVAASLTSDVDWVRLLGQLARVMPEDVTLQTFAGTAPLEGTSPPTPGQITVSATATKGNKSVVGWLQSLTRLPSIDDAWVSTVSAEAPPLRGVSFSSSANLTTMAGSSRLNEIVGGPGAS